MTDNTQELDEILKERVKDILKRGWWGGSIKDNKTYIYHDAFRDMEQLIQQEIAKARISELDWALFRLNTFGKETDSEALRRAIDEIDDNIAELSQTLKEHKEE